MTLTIENLQEIAKTENDAVESYPYRINVCVAAGCLSCGSDAVKASLEEEIRRQGKEKACRVRAVGCLGLCAVGPLIDISPLNVAYQGVQPSDAPDIIGSLTGAPVSRLLLPTDQPFFSRQKKIVLENCGIVEPERIESYIAAGGYEALYQALRQMSPRQVIDEVTASGLRGRGGAGFPTGLKWTTVHKSQQADKYVVCNADEGDPGAFMDRSVLESDPHRVIEGMAIAGYAVGAARGYVYVRAEYPLAVERLRRAIKQAKQLGILGENIFNTPFAFDIQLRLGAGAFVCGEETALIASIEGRLGRPRPRPPFPAEFGLWGCPTLINNVETIANIAPIVRRGGDWFAGIGTEKSKGTKVFALAGKINNTGLIEVPMGTPLREIVFDIGGGIPAGRRFKAVQTGGPSGGCVPAQFLDMPMDYESLKDVGAIMGSGGMIVMDDGACMVDVAKFFMEFCMSESCGKCVPCRVGTAQLFGILERITAGDAKIEDIDTLKELCDLVGAASLCGLGQTAPNPVKSTLRYFENEYMAHIRRHHCEAGVCAMGKAREDTA